MTPRHQKRSDDPATANTLRATTDADCHRQSDQDEERLALRSMTNLFHSSLARLPDELVADCELRGVKPAAGLNRTRVRISIARAEVTAALPSELGSGLHYSQLPFASSLEEIEDFDFELQRNADQLERRGQLRQIIGLAAVNVAVNLVWLMIIPASSDARNGWLLIARILAIWAVYALSNTAIWLRLLDRVPYPIPSDLERHAFSRWRNARLAERLEGDKPLERSLKTAL